MCMFLKQCVEGLTNKPMKFATMEGFKTMSKAHTMEIGFNAIARSVKPNYRLVGFDLDEGGRQVGALNAPHFAQATFLMHFTRVPLVIPLVFVWSWLGQENHHCG